MVKFGRGERLRDRDAREAHFFLGITEVIVICCDPERL